MVDFRHEDRKLLCYHSKAIVPEYQERIERIQRLKATHGYHVKSYHKYFHVYWDDPQLASINTDSNKSNSKMTIQVLLNQEKKNKCEFEL